MNQPARTRQFSGPRRQRGVSKLGLLVLFFMIASFLLVGLRVVPLYVDNNLIVGLCEDFIQNGEIENMTQSDVRERISNSLRINNVTDFDLSDIRLRKEDGKSTITIAYERRVPLVANLEIIAVFDSTLQ